MKSITGIGLSDVQAVYSGPEGKLWQLIMGSHGRARSRRGASLFGRRAEDAAGFH